MIVKYDLTIQVSHLFDMWILFCEWTLEGRFQFWLALRLSNWEIRPKHGWKPPKTIKKSLVFYYSRVVSWKKARQLLLNPASHCELNDTSKIPNLIIIQWTGCERITVEMYSFMYTWTKCDTFGIQKDLYMEQMHIVYQHGIFHAARINILYKRST